MCILSILGLKLLLVKRGIIGHGTNDTTAGVEVNMETKTENKFNLIDELKKVLPGAFITGDAARRFVWKFRRLDPKVRTRYILRMSYVWLMANEFPEKLMPGMKQLSWTDQALAQRALLMATEMHAMMHVSDWGDEMAVLMGETIERPDLPSKAERRMVPGRFREGLQCGEGSREDFDRFATFAADALDAHVLKIKAAGLKPQDAGFGLPCGLGDRACEIATKRFVGSSGLPQGLQDALRGLMDGLMRIEDEDRKDGDWDGA